MPSACMSKRRQPRTISAADIAKGASAERTFREWLDRSEVPHIYVEQTAESVPLPLRGKLKRPDFLVGVPGVGTIAFDVKAKTVYDGQLIFDLGEVRKLRTFARMFHLTVYFACLDPQHCERSYWVRLDQLDDVPAFQRNGSLTLSLALSESHPIALTTPFQTGFLAAIAR